MLQLSSCCHHQEAFAQLRTKSKAQMELNSWSGVANSEPRRKAQGKKELGPGLSTSDQNCNPPPVEPATLMGQNDPTPMWHQRGLPEVGF